MPLRILYASERPPYPLFLGGAVRCAHLLMRTLTDRHGARCMAAGSTDYAVSPWSYPEPSEYAALGVKEVCVDGPTGVLECGYPVRMLPRFLPALGELIDAFDPDVVWAQLEGARPILELARRKGRQGLLYLHDAEFDPAELKAITELGSHVVCCSEFLARKARKITGKPSHVVYPCTELDFGVVGDRDGCITMVNPYRVKGIATFFEIARRLPDERFLLVESWKMSDDAITALAARLASYPNVRFLRRVADMREVYRQTKLLLVPSVWEEGFGMVALEAQSCRIPVIASARGGLPESVGDGGVLVDAYQDAGAWLGAIDRLLRDDAAYRETAARALAHARLESFSVSSSAARFHDVCAGKAGAIAVHRVHGAPTARAIAFYLPQYHPIPENDRWWGNGFTEWTNVAKAQPLFRGHYQPHLPADLGFYDLRVAETRAAQADMARENGVEAFCYYYYWFAGKRLLERPFNEVLRSGEPDFPFCLCWANASWSGIWHGEPDRVLIEQTYPGTEDDEAHVQMLVQAFRDPRYVRVDGKPLYVIHRPLDIPNVETVIGRFRSLCERAGIGGLHLVGVTPHRIWDPREIGFDALVVQRMPPIDRSIPWRHPIAKVRARLANVQLTVVSHEEYLPRLMAPQVSKLEYYPCVLPNWDNTPRSGMNGLVLEGSTPALFLRHVRDALDRIQHKPREHRLLFIKSWNEWAEGNHLEPDVRFGHGYLEALQQALFESPPGAVSGPATDDTHLRRAAQVAAT